MNKLIRHIEYLRNNPMKIGFIHLINSNDRKQFHLFLESISIPNIPYPTIKKASLSIKKFEKEKNHKGFCEVCGYSIRLEFKEINDSASYSGICRNCERVFYNNVSDGINKKLMICMKNNTIAYGDYFRGYGNRSCKNESKYNNKTIQGLLNACEMIKELWADDQDKKIIQELSISKYKTIQEFCMNGSKIIEELSTDDNKIIQELLINSKLYIVNAPTTTSGQLIRLNKRELGVYINGVECIEFV